MKIQMEHLIANTTVSKEIKELILPIIEEMGFELVRVRYFSKKRATLQIMLDKDNNGIEINDCATISTALSTILDVNNPISDEYNLEISSPGINRPLTRKKDFDVWQGFNAKIKTSETIDKRTSFQGTLRGVAKNEILLEISEGTIGLDFEWIEEAKLSISTDLLFQKHELDRKKHENETRKF